MRSKTNQPHSRRLEAGTLANAEGLGYELRFPATFYPSEDNGSGGLDGGSVGQS
jgi:hypothetical protein